MVGNDVNRVVDELDLLALFDKVANTINTTTNTKNTPMNIAVRFTSFSPIHFRFWLSRHVKDLTSDYSESLQIITHYKIK